MVMRPMDIAASIRTAMQRLLQAVRDHRAASISIAVLVGVVLIGTILWIALRNQTVPEDYIAYDSGPSEDATVSESRRRIIDGVKVSSGTENMLPVTVMIENLSTARPQFGLSRAQVVYEALAEGGITRFLAIYASSDALETIGPVRSARDYYVDWAEEYHGVYVHAGGSPQALQRLVGNNYLTDLNQISGDHAYFWRDTSRAAPHNLFTSTELLGYALRDKGLSETVGSYSGWVFQKESAKKNRPASQSIKLSFSTSSYDVSYDYDAETNTYARSNGGAPHVDALTNDQIRVKNIIVQYVASSLLDASSGRLSLTTVGEGDAMVFINGVAIPARWKKPARGERTRYYGEDGSELSFAPGTIWIEVLPEGRTVEYN